MAMDAAPRSARGDTASVAAAAALPPPAAELMAAFEGARTTQALLEALRAIAAYCDGCSSGGERSGITDAALSGVARVAVTAADYGWDSTVAVAFGAALRAVRGGARS